MIGVQDRKGGRRQSPVQIRARRTLALLKARIAKLQTDLENELKKHEATPRESILQRVRRVQNNPKWLARVRAQYTPTVSQRTLELNDEFPLTAE